MNDPMESTQKRVIQRLSIPLIFIVSSLGAALFFFLIILRDFWIAIDELEPGAFTPGVGLAIMFFVPTGCAFSLMVGAIVTFFMARRGRKQSN
jgi:hypothetical protein